MGHHPGDIAVNTTQSSGGQISLLIWIIILVVLALFGYFVYWFFFQNSKKW